MKAFTLLGKLLVAGLSMIAAIACSIFVRSELFESRDQSSAQTFILGMESIMISIIAGIVVATVVGLAIVLTSRVRSTEIRKIYDNDRDIEVYVITSEDEHICAGEQLKRKIVSHSGVLTLKKDKVAIKQFIDKIEYLGMNQQGAKVDKIEYFEKHYENSFFGCPLLDNFKEICLKVYLEDPRSEEKLEKLTQTEDELKSFLYGNEKGDN